MTTATKQKQMVGQRAERKMGQLLQETERAKGAEGNPGGRGASIVRLPDVTTQPTLAELGISKIEQVAGRLASGNNFKGNQYQVVGSLDGTNQIKTLADYGLTAKESSRAQEVDEVEVVYQEGYLIPTEPQSGRFSIKRDDMLIAQGSHFWCVGHLQAIPLSERSPDNLDYCRSCWAGISAEKKVTRQEVGRWLKNDSIYRLDGRNYGVNKSGQTILVKEDSTKPLEGDVSQGYIGQNAVTKLTGGNILPPQSKAALKTGVVMQHPGGRPVKAGKVTRMTEWRRRKARK